jgi:lipid-A-disaccharide synthase
MVGSAAKLVMNRTYEVLREADAALVTSGTATLETALHGVTQVVCYRGSWLSYQIGKRLVDVKFISLVNLIADQQIVRELIQHDFSEKELTASLQALFAPETRQQMLANYETLYAKLGNKGASERIAADALRYLGWLR